MDFGKAFSFVFDDEEWLKKIGVGGLIILIPIVGQLVLLGWMVEIVRRVVNGDPEPLPDWSDFGGYLGKGFKAFVIGFVYSLPLVLLNICISIPSAMATSGGIDEDVMITVVSVTSICFGCLSILYGLFVSVVLPGAIGKFAVTDELGAAFKFGDVIRMVRGNLGAYGLVFLGSLLMGIIAPLGLIACVIGVLFTYAFAMAFYGHLIGQAYRESTGGSVVQAREEIPAADF